MLAGCVGACSVGILRRCIIVLRRGYGKERRFEP